MGFAFFAVLFGPDFVVGVLRELAEAVAALVVGDEAFDGEGVVVLEVDDGSVEWGVVLVGDFAFDDALDGAALLGQRRWWAEVGGCGADDGGGEEERLGGEETAAAESVGPHGGSIRRGDGYSSSSSPWWVGCSSS